MRAKQTKRIRRVRRHRLALALVGAMAMPVMPAVAQSLPESGSVTSGNASIGQSGTTMTITQTTKGAIIDWGSFNIASGHAVNFDQQFGTTSVTLNRVVGFGYGGSTSLINGSLTANGSVFLINPAGITFGSGAVVNVGGLVASALDIADADFLEGLSTGHYPFAAFDGVAGEILNFGQLTAADGGTVALIGSFIGNGGTITANFGSVGFGAAESVTLDYFGDGLTQVTISGNGLSRLACNPSCAGGISSSGNVFALGGHIEMRTNTIDGLPAGNDLFVDPANGGRIWISGNVSARTDGARRGSIVLDAGMGNIDLGGIEGQTGNVSTNAVNDGDDAGTIEIRANQLFTHLCVWTGDQCVNNNQLGFINATAYGAGGMGGEIRIDVGRLYHAGWIQAGSVSGTGGLIDIAAGSAEIYSIITAESAGGQGGTINVTADSLLLHRGQTPWLGGPGTNYSLATLAAFGATSGGTVNLDAGTFSMVDLGDVSPEDVNLDEVYRPTISVNGFGGNGGSINVTTSNFALSPWQYFEAIGTEAGGSIDIFADSIHLAGGLVATGGTTWGSVTTTATDSLFAAASAYIRAGTWQVHVPSVRIVSADDAQPGAGAVLTDAALSSTLDGGTTIDIYADGAMGPDATGSIHIEEGVSILHESDDAAALLLSATAGIYGSGFDIESTGGPLDLTFIANVHGDNPDGGYVSFYDIGLASNGGDIVMDGDGRGIYVHDSQVSSGGGDITIGGNGVENGVLLQGTSVDSDSGAITIVGVSDDGAGVRLADVDIAIGDGSLDIAGTGADGTWIAYSDLSSTGGDISILGDGVFAGVYLMSTTVSSEGAGGIAIVGTASLENPGDYPFGVALAGSTLTTDSGDVSVAGEAPGGNGLLFWNANGIDPAIASTSGAVALTSTGLHGLGLGGLHITTDSGDISIVGTATDDDATAAVFVSSAGLSSNGGDISITGSGGQTGVWLYQGDIASNGGDITVTGEGSEYGVQVWENLLSSGAGNIVIDGTATGTASTATGISMRDAALEATSGNIVLVGDAQHGIGVFFGGLSYGPDSSVTTTSGDITVDSTGLSGLDVTDVPFTTDSGGITLRGTALGDDFGVYIGAGGLSTNGGDINILGYATSYTGVFINGGDIASHGGDIVITGGSTEAAGVQISDSDIDSGGGDIDIGGDGGVTGLVLENASSVDAGTGVVVLRAGNAGSGDAIVLHGTVASDTAVVLRPVDAQDAILLGAGNGFSLTGAELAQIDAPLLVIGGTQHAGAIRVGEDVEWDGDLTLQNQGGSGGIAIEAAIDVGEHTLALASGGDIGQTEAGAITAHSLLAIADGDVSLVAADNNVAADSVAGSAGGDFAYEDVDDVAIGEVASQGWHEGVDVQGGLSTLSASGIDAGGSVLVRSDTGDLILGADVSGSSIDLIAEELFRNIAGATLSAPEGWRIWARTWEGEERGGLAGDGPFDVFGCSFGGECSGIGAGNQFIYREQRFMQSPVAPESVVEWMDDDSPGSGAQDLLAAICPVGDLEEDSLLQGEGNDELARQWLKSRHRLRLSNCIDSKNAPGCRF